MRDRVGDRVDVDRGSDAAGPDVLVGAGDIGVCGSSASAATAAVIDGIDGTVMTLGDNAYPDGSDADYASCYDPTWGHLKSRTRPVAGNHEYVTESGRPYYDYFGDAAGPRSKGWYSYDQAGWHIIVLNSNVDMSPNSEQLTWLRSDLAAHPTVCAAAMWHHPRFSSGEYAPGVASVADAWNALYDGGVDVVLNGHEHYYERFAPMNRIGTADPTGMRAFTVGTGGAPLRTAGRGDAALPDERGPALGHVRRDLAHAGADRLRLGLPPGRREDLHRSRHRHVHRRRADRAGPDDHCATGARRTDRTRLVHAVGTGRAGQLPRSAARGNRSRASRASASAACGRRS